MRTVLLILATLAALAVCLALVVAFGLLRMSAAPPPGLNALAPSTLPATEPAADEPILPSPVTSPITIIGPERDPAGAPPERSIVLHASDAKLSGPRITVGGQIAGKKQGNKVKDPTPVIWKWREPADRAEWRFNVPKPGRYAITLRCSAGADTQQDATFVLSVAGTDLVQSVPQTQKSANFQVMDVGTVELPAGPAHLVIHPKEKLTAGLMNLREVELIQVE